MTGFVMMKVLTFITLWANSADDKMIIFSYFPQIIGFDISCKYFLRKLFAWDVKFYFLGKIKENISKRYLLKFLLSMLSVKVLNMPLLTLFSDRIYPKYREALTHYHTCQHFYHSLTDWGVQNCQWSEKQYRPWSDAAFYGVWSGSKLFAQTCLTQYWG